MLQNMMWPVRPAERRGEMMVQGLEAAHRREYVTVFQQMADVSLF